MKTHVCTLTVQGEGMCNVSIIKHINVLYNK